MTQQQAKIALCIPTVGPPTWQLFDSFGIWQSYHQAHHPEVRVDIIRPPRPLPIDVARNYLAERVLEGDYSHLWFTDQDAVYRPQTLDRLMAWDVPIAGALCFVRASTFCPPMVFKGEKGDQPGAWHIMVDEVYEYARTHMDTRTNEPQLVDPIPEGSLVDVDITGCHCLLIQREVLDAMEPPWFSGRPGQEDMFFCRKAAGLGYPVRVDFSTLAGHATGARIIGVYEYLAHYVYQGLLEDAYEFRPTEREDS